MSEAPTVWTVGHSNHSLDRFLGLLQACQIAVVADVRSQPYSRYAQHFSQSPLSRALAAAGLGYLFFGRELGGRPPEAELYDAEGHVLYGALAETPRFGEGLSRLRDAALERRVVMMCSEEDPSHCHRRLLVTRAMLAADPTASVLHIRGDGTLVGETDLVQAIQGERQLELFEEVETWRSARSASPSTLQGASSAR